MLDGTGWALGRRTTSLMADFFVSTVQIAMGAWKVGMMPAAPEAPMSPNVRLRAATVKSPS
jgi:hypothetical protein